MLDLDRFKHVNDAHGHLAGDMVLRVVASHLARLIRIEDVLARYGGEEFVILVRSTSRDDAAKLAERVRTTVEHSRSPLPRTARRSPSRRASGSLRWLSWARRLRATISSRRPTRASTERRSTGEIASARTTEPGACERPRVVPLRSAMFDWRHSAWLLLLASPLGCSSNGDAASPHDASVEPADATADATMDADVDGAPVLPSEVTFPSTFMWGTSTAAFQVEKGDSNTDWAAWAALPGKIKDGGSPDIGGDDALNHIPGDIALMTAEGHNSYRFSIEMARVFPTQFQLDSNLPTPRASPRTTR